MAQHRRPRAQLVDRSKSAPGVLELAEFDQHALAPVLRSAPGLGPVLAARVLVEVGDDPARFASADNLRAFAGTARMTRASGRSRSVKAPRVRNKRLGDACHWWAFATLPRSAGARAHYDRRRAAGDHHNAVLRNLANKLIGRLWWCYEPTYTERHVVAVHCYHNLVFIIKGDNSEGSTGPHH